MPLQFLKMHGAGNDFAIFDARKEVITFPPAQLQAIAGRRTGVGCDQIIIMESPAGSPAIKGKGKHRNGNADVFMRIYNADGSEVSSCGNATRCISWLIMEETGNASAIVQTAAGLLACERTGDRRIRTDMGEPCFDWRKIPLSEPRNVLHLGLSLGDLTDPAAVGMGNPHMVFAVPSAANVPVSEVGPELEHYPLFPERVNVSFAEVVNKTRVKLRVWERGAGETFACGTAACATLAALHKRGVLAESADVELPGGTLHIEWDKTSNHIWMTGPVALSFSGLLYL